MSQLDLVRVYDTSNLDAAPTDVLLDGSDPRNLAVNAAGNIYVTILESGNNTTIVPEAVVDSTLGLPPAVPPMDTSLAAPPKVSLIVRHNGTNWVDEISRVWDTWLPYQLYDNDVIEINANTLSVTQAFNNVGSTIFNVAVNPVTGRLYVSNVEATSEIRFEPNLKGQFIRDNVTTIDPAGPTVTQVHLNSHINYGNPAGTPGERALSIGQPLDLAVSSDGNDVYVAGFGSNLVGVLDAAGVVQRRIAVGQGPAGLALDEARNKLYVWCRHFSSISVVDLSDDSFTDVSLGFDPTDFNVQVGRVFFYSTPNSSAHGDISCGSCHTFTGMDGLAWDLGDPTGPMTPAPQPQSGPLHPMKGPLMTQALKSLNGTLPLHWRGDRADVESFNGAFVSLQGRPDTLSAGDMAFFKTFVTSVMYPPNPNRNLDGSLPNPGSSPDPQEGENLFFTGGLVGGSNCDFCHAMPTGTSGTIFPGGSILENQSFESPQFRNLYEKTRFDPTQPFTVRGFGFTHAGEEPRMFDFFTNSGIFTFNNDDEKRDVEAFLMAFDTGTHAAVGAQLTMDGTNEATWLTRLNTLISEAAADEIGLVAKGVSHGAKRGWMYDSVTSMWQSDRSWANQISTTELLAFAGPGTEITFTAVVKGCETRIGVDRDNDGFYDREEVDSGTDPADPLSFPATLEVPNTGQFDERLAIVRLAPNPVTSGSAAIQYSLADSGPLTVRIYNVQGQLVRTVKEFSNHGAGQFRETWDLLDREGRRVPSGIYFVRIASGKTHTAGRLVVTR